MINQYVLIFVYQYFMY